jgi:hypothetical protein
MQLIGVSLAAAHLCKMMWLWLMQVEHSTAGVNCSMQLLAAGSCWCVVWSSWACCLCDM